MKIYLIGDSTCQTNFADTYPQTGWGQKLPQFVKEGIEVINLAKNGRSTKSFIDEGLFKEVEENIQAGDYLFIQFGHNDEKDDPLRHSDPFTTYQENLLYFINVARFHQATPILISSIYRRHFDEMGHLEEKCHGDYPLAMALLAKKENLIYIDMTSITKGFLEEIGDEASKKYFMNFPAHVYSNYPEGKEDNTHLTTLGAEKICSLLVEQMKNIPSLNNLLK
jgi:lysophospholipase L1-like esterase